MYIFFFFFFCKYLEKIKLICGTLHTYIEVIRNIDFYIFKNIEINDMAFFL